MLGATVFLFRPDIVDDAIEEALSRGEGRDDIGVIEPAGVVEWQFVEGEGGFHRISRRFQNSRRRKERNE